MLKVNGKKPVGLDYLMIIVGTGLMSLAINSVFDAAGMVTGGFSGIAIIIKAWTKNLIEGGIPLWVTNCVLNLPLFVIAWKVRGFSFIKRAILGEISLSVWLAIQPVWNLAGNDLLLSALYGGVIQGVGIGLVFLGGGTTGGTDMMAAIIHSTPEAMAEAGVYEDSIRISVGIEDIEDLIADFTEAVEGLE